MHDVVGGTKEHALLGWLFFGREIFILKTMMFCGGVMTVFKQRKHLKMVIESLPDSVSLMPNRVAGPRCFTPCTTTKVVVPLHMFQMLVPLAATLGGTGWGTCCDAAAPHPWQCVLVGPS